jgi:hypothetical protein
VYMADVALGTRVASKLRRVSLRSARMLYAALGLYYPRAL